MLKGRGHGYGVELDVARCRSAQGRLSKVICSDTIEARLSRGAFGLVFLNPPYADSIHGRLEVTFLERAIEWLAPDGVLVYIIKAASYTGEVSRILSRHFTEFRHARFPDPYFSGPELAFRQTVLICRKKAVPQADPAAMAKLQSSSLTLEPLEPGETYAVPCGSYPSVFLPGALTPEQIVELLKLSPTSRIPTRSSDLGGVPPLPLSKGHQALILASGLVDGVYGRGARLHVNKGTIRRTTTKKKQIEYDNNDRPTVTVIETEGFEILIRALTPEGVIHDVAGAKPAKDAKDDEQIVETEDAA